MILIYFHFTNTYSNLHSLILYYVVILLNSFIIKNLFYSPVKSAVVREKLHVAKKNYSSRIINFPSRKINSHGGDLFNLIIYGFCTEIIAFSPIFITFAKAEVNGTSA